MKTKARKGKAANWQTVRERLTNALNATKATYDLTPEQGDALMRTRAQALGGASATTADSGASATEEVVFFNLGTQPFAIASGYVREIRKLGSFCPVPGVPDYVLGLAALRGEMLAIFDLCRLLGMPPSNLTGSARLIVLGLGAPELAIVADTVEQTANLRQADLMEPPEAIAGPHRLWVQGITTEGRTLLNGKALLADESLFIARAPGRTQLNQ